MKVQMQSMLTGLIHTMDLDVTQEQMDIWNSPNPPLIQNLFPNLTSEEREFLLTGSTQEEWDAAFPEEDEDSPDESAF